MSNPKIKVYISLLEIAVKLQIKNFLLKRQLQDHHLINQFLQQPNTSPEQQIANQQLIQDLNQATSFIAYGIHTHLVHIAVNAGLRVSLHFHVEHQIAGQITYLQGVYSNHSWRWDKLSLDQFMQSVHWPMVETIHDQLLSHLAD